MTTFGTMRNGKHFWRTLKASALWNLSCLTAGGRSMLTSPFSPPPKWVDHRGPPPGAPWHHRASQASSPFATTAPASACARLVGTNVTRPTPRYSNTHSRIQPAAPNAETHPETRFIGIDLQVLGAANNSRHEVAGTTAIGACPEIDHIWDIAKWSGIDMVCPGRRVSYVCLRNRCLDTGVFHVVTHASKSVSPPVVGMRFGYPGQYRRPDAAPAARCAEGGRCIEDLPRVSSFVSEMAQR